MTYNPCDY